MFTFALISDEWSFRSIFRDHLTGDISQFVHKSQESVLQRRTYIFIYLYSFSNLLIIKLYQPPQNCNIEFHTTLYLVAEVPCLTLYTIFLKFMLWMKSTIIWYSFMGDISHSSFFTIEASSSVVNWRKRLKTSSVQFPVSEKVMAVKKYWKKYCSF